MTLTLELCLPEGFEAIRFPRWHPEPCLEALPPHQLPTLALEIPKASEGTALDLFIHSRTHLHFFSSLFHSLIAVKLPPAPLNIETALAKPLLPIAWRLLGPRCSTGRNRSLLPDPPGLCPLFVRLDSRHTSLSQSSSSDSSL